MAVAPTTGLLRHGCCPQQLSGTPDHPEAPLQQNLSRPHNQTQAPPLPCAPAVPSRVRSRCLPIGSAISTWSAIPRLIGWDEGRSSLRGLGATSAPARCKVRGRSPAARGWGGGARSPLLPARARGSSRAPGPAALRGRGEQCLSRQRGSVGPEWPSAFPLSAKARGQDERRGRQRGVLPAAAAPAAVRGRARRRGRCRSLHLRGPGRRVRLRVGPGEEGLVPQGACLRHRRRAGRCLRSGLARRRLVATALNGAAFDVSNLVLLSILIVVSAAIFVLLVEVEQPNSHYRGPDEKQRSAFVFSVVIIWKLCKCKDFFPFLRSCTWKLSVFDRRDFVQTRNVIFDEFRDATSLMWWASLLICRWNTVVTM